MFLFDDYFVYFQSIADKLVGVSDFHHYDVLEFLDNQNNGKVNTSNYVLFLETYQAEISGQYLDNLRHQKTASFMILRKLPTRDSDEKPLTSAKAKALVLAESERLVLEVIAKMKSDKTNPHLRFMRGLDLTSFQLFKLGPVLSGAYGWRAEFQFHDQAKLTLNKELWNA